MNEICIVLLNWTSTVAKKFILKLPVGNGVTINFNCTVGPVTFSISSNSIDGQLSDTEKVESCYAFAVSHMRLLVNMYKLSKLF